MHVPRKRGEVRRGTHPVPLMLGSGVAMGNHSRTSPGSASCEARSAIFPAGVRMIPDSNGTRASIDRDDYLSFACFFFPC